MKRYELAVLLHPDLEIDLKTATKKLENIFNDVNAKLISADDWGKRKLAYDINKQSFAIYQFYLLEIEPEAIAKLEQALRLSDEVLRYLVVLADEDKIESVDKRAETKKAAVKKIKKVTAKAGKE